MKLIELMILVLCAIAIVKLVDAGVKKCKNKAMLFGVCAGIAKHIGWPAFGVRLVAVLTIPLGGAPVFIYAGLALLLSEE
jgi:phage shock protein PspC (stress-responsive transcriptional regulator)